MATEFGKRLKAARKYAKLTQEQLAKLTGIAQSTISTAEREGSGSTSTTTFASACGVSAHWLETGEGEMVIKNHIQSSNVSPVELGRSVPLISWVQAGMWEEIQDSFQPGEADQWIAPQQSKPGKHAYALRVEGDSMTSPIPGAISFPEGTMLVVDPQAGFGPGNFVIAKDVSTQKATFKQLATDAGRWFLKPLNPAFPTIEIDDPNVRVIGRVIEAQPPALKL